MKTIFLSITHGFQARNLLHTDVLRVLKASGVRIVILTPNYSDAYFVKEFAAPNVFIEPLTMGSSRAEQIAASIRRLVVANYKLNRTTHLLNENFRRSRRPKYVLFRALNAIFGRIKAARDAWTAGEALLFPDRDHGSVFAKYLPDLVVTGTPGSIPADAHLIRRAHLHKVPTACVILSWDNLTSKGHMAALPDYLVVWNEINRREAIELHDYPAERISVAGVAHFDVYAERERIKSREQFCADMGLDPARRIITLGTVTPWLFPHNAEVAEILARANADGRFSVPAQVLIRLHPQVMNKGTIHTENVERYQEIAAQYPHVILDLPGVRSEALMWDLPSSDMLHLAALMLHSDVTLNAGSTLTIDSAIFDTPVVGIGFDGYASKPYASSIIRAYDYTHFANVVRTGGLRIARSADEMVAAINAYLADPSLDRGGRERIVREQCYKIDGQSGRRVANVLLEQIGMAPVALPQPASVIP